MGVGVIPPYCQDLLCTNFREFGSNVKARTLWKSVVRGCARFYGHFGLNEMQELFRMSDDLASIWDKICYLASFGLLSNEYRYFLLQEIGEPIVECNDICTCYVVS